LSGIQPTGFIHLGNYLGAVQNWVKIQDDPTINSRLFCIVDYHAITQKYIGVDLPEMVSGGIAEEPGLLKETVNKDGSPAELTLKTAATLLACGINPQQSTLFV
jgi:tryptophanyl-tRNA synthetase